ncbi:hypothetical protein CMO84_03475 [Candidatus Woesearchaeota archaeon]|nr:hypothetical protein [Candidatus Woesearchaeota archaeon]
MSNFPSDFTPSEPDSSPEGQSSHLPPTEGGEDFLGLEQILGGGSAETQAAGPQPLLPEVTGEHGEAQIAQLMGAPIAPVVMEETVEEGPDVVLDPEPMHESTELVDEEGDAPDMAPGPTRRRGPTRSLVSLVGGSLLCVWSLSQWNPSVGTSTPPLTTAMVSEVSTLTPAPPPILQPPALEASTPPVVAQASLRPVAVVAPLRARLTALLRLAASMPRTPGPRMVPGAQAQTSPAPPPRPHRGRRSWRASLDLILAQSVGAQNLQMGSVLLGGGWNPLQPEPLVLPLNDLAPQGLGVLSSTALGLRAGLPSNTSSETQRESALGEDYLVASLMPTAMPSQEEQTTSDPQRGLTPAPQGKRWTQPEIPEGAIAQPDRMLTPGVGVVRATLHGGEVFEGRLHQVGMGQIWIDTRLGRMSLEAHRLASLETLETPGTAETGDRLGSRQVGRLTQVSVGVPGGLLTGALLSRDGDEVTLRIADGLQVTVTSDDVRLLAGPSATLGVRPRGVDGQR